MKTALLLFAGTALWAQPVVTVTGPPTVSAGKPAVLTVSLSGTAGSNLAAFEISLAGGSLGAPQISNSSTLGVFCNASTCLVMGLTSLTGAATTSDNALADGPVFTIPVTFSASGQLAIGNPLGMSTAATSVVLAAGPPYTAKVSTISACDANGDGKVDVADAQAVVSALISGTGCPQGFAAGCTLTAAVGILIASAGGACVL